MRRTVAFLVLVLVLGLWLFSSTHAQQSVGQDDATVQAQMTAVLKATSTPGR